MSKKNYTINRKIFNLIIGTNPSTSSAMKKLCSLSILVITILFIYSCSNSNSTSEQELSLEQEIVEIEQLVNALGEKERANKLLLKADKQLINTRELWVLTFETQDTLLLSTDLVIDVETDPINWQALVIVAESSPIEVPFLGNRILNEGAYSLKVNPYGNAPLTAELTIGTRVSGKMRVVVKGRGEFGIDIAKTFEAVGKTFQLPILGLYNNHQNEVEIQFLDEANNLRIAETITIPTQNFNLPTVQVIKNNLEPNDAGIYFSSDLKMGFDQRGQVRWLWLGNDQYFFRRLENGNLLFTTNDDRVSYHSRYFIEVSILGQEIKRYRVPNYFHHEIREMPNGNFLVATNSTPIVLGNGQKQEDTIVEIDRQSGEVIHTIDFSTILDPNRLRMPGERAEDWLHNNAIYYDQERQEILVSGRAQSAIVNVSYPSGDLNWILSAHEEWNETLQPYLLTPVDASGNPIDITNQDFWTYGQHAVLKLPNGNILTYDNGLYRGYYKNRNAPYASYSRAVEYKVDENQMTIQKVWEFNMDKRFFTPFTGDVDYFPQSGNRLIGFMWGSADTPRVVEINERDEILFEMLINQGQNSYRTEKVYLY